MNGTDAPGAGGSVVAPDAPAVTDVASASDATHVSDVPGIRGADASTFGSSGTPGSSTTLGSSIPSVLHGLPGGLAADVVSVPEAAGREALARLLGYGQPAVAPGPVALSAGGRVLFYVAPGGREDLPELLDWLDWGGVQLDLTASSGPESADPPVRWLHPASVPIQSPGPDDGDRHASHPVAGLPEPPELIALLATIAAACHRLAVTRGGRAPSRPEPGGRAGYRPGFAAS